MEPMNFPLQYCPLLSSFLFYLGMTAVQISTQAPRLPSPPPSLYPAITTVPLSRVKSPL